MLYPKQGPDLSVLLGFLVGHQLRWCGNAFFFSFDNTDCVILYHIKTVEFDPSWLLGVHRKSSWDVPGVTWGVWGEVEHTSNRHSQP